MLQIRRALLAASLITLAVSTGVEIKLWPLPSPVKALGVCHFPTFRQAMEKDPSFVIEHAVKGMLPHTPLGRQMLKKLKVYSGTEHPHGAQQPRELKFEGLLR